jgi:hypothetical protein
MPSETISLDAVALRTRIKHHFQRALERAGSHGVSYQELADVITADSELSGANPDLVALVSDSVWRTHGAHKVHVGSIRARAVISDGERRYLARAALTHVWQARAELLAGIAGLIAQAGDDSARVAEAVAHGN